jgi:hypothetical protein
VTHHCRMIFSRLGNGIVTNSYQYFILARWDENNNEIARCDHGTVLSHIARVTSSNDIDRRLRVNDVNRSTLSVQAPTFQLPSPIHMPLSTSPVDDSAFETSSMDENNSQPERSDTPFSINSTGSNESNTTPYCGYVESYPCK